MIHLGKNTRSTIISKGISAGKSQNSYRGLVQVGPRAKNARNFSQCDSLLMGNDVEHTLSLTLKQKVILPKLNTKQPPVKLEKIKFFIATKEELILKKPLL